MRLGQGFDEGWGAFEIKNQIPKIKTLMPWWFGERLEQVKVDGWQNGFVLPDSGSMIQDSREIAIIYWPQYLEWLGLLLVAGTFGFLGFKVLKYRQK